MTTNELYYASKLFHDIRAGKSITEQDRAFLIKLRDKAEAKKELTISRLIGVML